MSELASQSSGVAERYALALFSLCKEEGQLGSLQKDLEALSKLLETSKDFRFFVKSPMYRREQQEAAVNLVAEYLETLDNTKNLLCLLARKGRIFLVKEFVEKVRELLDEERDEMSVEIVSAIKLSKDQVNQLERVVGKLSKKKAKLQVRIDRALIGGMIVKLGSKMIDTTTKSKLVKLQTTMKEVN